MVSHNLDVRSPPPLASVLPSGENAIAKTVDVCPESEVNCLPDALSQSLTVESLLLVAIILPSGEKARSV